MQPAQDTGTVVAMWDAAQRAERSFPAFLARRGREWHAVGWAEAGEQVDRLAGGLLASGIAHGDRVGILVGTCPEWTVCDYALQSIGAVPVPLYATSSTSDAAHVLADCGARMLIVEAGRYEPLAEAIATTSIEPVLVHGAREGVLALDDLIARGGETDPAAVAAARAAVGAGDVSSIVYTSGTTGPPKGCVLTHGNMRAMTDTVAGIPELLHPAETVLLFLPLAHSFARLMQNLAVKVGITIAYCPDLRTVPAALSELRPAILPSIPRAYEMLYRQISGQIADISGSAHLLASWALGVGARAERRRQEGRHPSIRLRAEYALADRILFSRVRRRVGGQLRLAISGGAPLSPQVAEYLAGVGIPVMEGYGLSEATCASHFNLPGPGQHRFGTVGRALPGVAVRLAGDGEVQLDGPTVFVGYHGNPAATRAVMTEDGWLRTGDLGEIDADGFLRITGRKKDLIVTAGGENVAPLRIEASLIADPLLSQALVLGDQRPYLVALLTVDPAEQRRRGLDERAAIDAVARIVEQVNANLGAAERIRRHAVLEREFSQEAGEVTPTLKLRRDACVAHNRERIAQLYGRSEA